MYEFTGKTEQEAIERASEALELDSSQFDVEILESESGLFRKGSVRIRVYSHSEDKQEEDWLSYSEESEELSDWREVTDAKPWEIQIRDFVQELLLRLGQDCKILLYSRGEAQENLLLNVPDAVDPSQLIGKHGRHLESLQVILNAYLGRLHDEKNEVPKNLHAHLDIGDYRKRREAKLVKVAKDTAAQVEKRKGSRLLEEMNPFERRIIHRALNDWPNISTLSEGDGTYKQVRIIYRGSSN